MPIIPTGRPIWERSGDHTSYGGDPNKRNHLGQGSIDSLTDVSAEEFSRLVADLAAVARTAPFMTLTYQCNDTSPAAPTVLSATGMLGRRTTQYAGNAAPSGFPSAVRNGNGDVTFTFASSYLDPYGVAGTFVLSHPRACLVAATGAIGCDVLSDTTVRVRAFDYLGNPYGDVKITLVVHSGG